MSEANSICAPEEKLVEYREVVGYPGYRVGSDGSVWSCWRLAGGGSGRHSFISSDWRELTKKAGSRGYPIVGLTRDKKVKTVYVQSLVLEAFVGPRPAGMQACHYPDPTATNVALCNLKWGTPSENNRHKEVQGTHQIGEKNPRALKITLTEKDAHV